MPCQDEKCQEQVEGHQKSLYGQDGTGGIVGKLSRIEGCLGKYVSRKWLITSICSVLGFLLVVTVPILSSTSSKMHAVDKKADVNQTMIKNMDKTVQKIEKRLEQYHKDIEKKLESNKREIIEQFKLIIKSRDRRP